MWSVLYEQLSNWTRVACFAGHKIKLRHWLNASCIPLPDTSYLTNKPQWFELHDEVDSERFGPPASGVGAGAGRAGSPPSSRPAAPAGRRRDQSPPPSHPGEHPLFPEVPQNRHKVKEFYFCLKWQSTAEHHLRICTGRRCITTQ